MKEYQTLIERCNNKTADEIREIAKYFDDFSSAQDDYTRQMVYYGTHFFKGSDDAIFQLVPNPDMAKNNKYETLIEFIAHDAYLNNVYKPLIYGGISYRVFCDDWRDLGDLDVSVSHDPLAFAQYLIERFCDDDFRLYHGGDNMINIQFGIWSIDINYQIGYRQTTESLGENRYCKLGPYGFGVQNPFLCIHAQLKYILNATTAESSLNRSHKLVKDINAIIKKKFKYENSVSNSQTVTR